MRILFLKSDTKHSTQTVFCKQEDLTSQLASSYDGRQRYICTTVLPKVGYLELFDVQFSYRIGGELLPSSKRRFRQDFHTLIVRRAVVPLALTPIFAILGEDIVGTNIV